MHDHHETEGVSLRDRAGLFAANLIALAALIAGAINVPELLLAVIR